MKIEFKLTETHQLILLSLHWFEQLSLYRLIKAVILLKTSQLDYVSLLRELVAKDVFKNLASPSGSPIQIIYDGIKKEIETLEMLLLIRLDKSSPSSDYRPINVLTDDFVLVDLTEEGRRVASGIADGRRVLIRPPQPRRSTMFVACAFGYHEIDQLYENQLRPACEGVGYHAFRVDLNEPPQTITELILQGIIDSECMIADLSFARPSVYFEIGFAHGLGIPILLTCRQDHYRGVEDQLKVHFDLEQYKISYWSRIKDVFQ
jgi:hypothetical protein